MKSEVNEHGFGSIPENEGGSKRDQQVVAARHLVQALELAEALPFTPKQNIDPPAVRRKTKNGGLR